MSLRGVCRHFRAIADDPALHATDISLDVSLFVSEASDGAKVSNPAVETLATFPKFLLGNARRVSLCSSAPAGSWDAAPALVARLPLVCPRLEAIDAQPLLSRCTEERLGALRNAVDAVAEAGGSADGPHCPPLRLHLEWPSEEAVDTDALASAVDGRVIGGRRFVVELAVRVFGDEQLEAIPPELRGRVRTIRASRHQDVGYWAGLPDGITELHLLAVAVGQADLAPLRRLTALTHVEIASSSLPCEEPLPVDAWPALETLVITLGEGARTSDSLVHALADSVALRTTLRRLELPRPLTPDGAARLVELEALRDLSVDWGREAETLAVLPSLTQIEVLRIRGGRQRMVTPAHLAPLSRLRGLCLEELRPVSFSGPEPYVAHLTELMPTLGDRLTAFYAGTRIVDFDGGSLADDLAAGLPRLHTFNAPKPDGPVDKHGYTLPSSGMVVYWYGPLSYYP